MISKLEECAASDDAIGRALTDLKLDSLLTSFGLDTRHYWENNLPLFEQKLLVIARALIVRPNFLLLDRPSSSLNKETLDWIMGLLRQHGITYMTFEKSGGDLARYDALLELKPGGAWQVRPIKNGQVVDPAPA